MGSTKYQKKIEKKFEKMFQMYLILDLDGYSPEIDNEE